MVAVPRLVGDLVRCAPDRDLTVVGARPTASSLGAEVDKTAANVVLVGSEDATLPEPCRALLTSRPDVKVIVIRADAERATLYERRRRHEVLAHVSPQGLVATIRNVLQHEASAWRA